VTAIGLGAPAFVDADRPSVLFAQNIGWIGEPSRSR
jgi:glucokinase